MPYPLDPTELMVNATKSVRRSLKKKLVRGKVVPMDHAEIKRNTTNKRKREWWAQKKAEDPIACEAYRQKRNARRIELRAERRKDSIMHADYKLKQNERARELRAKKKAADPIAFDAFRLKRNQRARELYVPDR